MSFYDLKTARSPSRPRSSSHKDECSLRELGEYIASLEEQLLTALQPCFAMVGEEASAGSAITDGTGGYQIWDSWVAVGTPESIGQSQGRLRVDVPGLYLLSWHMSVEVDDATLEYLFHPHHETANYDPVALKEYGASIDATETTTERKSVAGGGVVRANARDVFDLRVDSDTGTVTLFEGGLSLVKVGV